jgi:cysteine-rich repeat protein
MISVRTALRAALVAAFVLWTTPLAARCTGDCDGSGAVTVDEVLTGVNIALGNAPLDTCSAFDANGDHAVTVDEILAAVNNALNGCPIVATPTATPTATATVLRLTPTPPPGCGNGVVDFNLGETCDDGNTIDDDGPKAVNPCPANCRIASCASTANTVTADVSFTPASGVDIAGLTMFLRYPDGVVQIPGHASDDQVQNSILNLPGNAFATPNDLDFALRLVIVSTDQTPFSPGLVFSLQFGTCQGAAPPAASDFTCIVEDAADTSLQTVTGVTCAVTLE